MPSLPGCAAVAGRRRAGLARRSEEHTSELQSLTNLLCRLLLEKKKKRHHVGTGRPSAGEMMRDAGFAWATTDIADVVDAVHRSMAVYLIAHSGRGDGDVRVDAV